MDFNYICECAYNYYLHNMNIKGLCTAIDIGEYIVFFAGDPTKVNYGGSLVSVKKDNYMLEELSVIKIIELITHSEEIDIPDKYMFKK